MKKAGKIDAEKFWQRVDIVREGVGITWVELQQLIGKSGTYLYVSKSNNALPSLEAIMSMSDVLGCTVDYLIDHVKHSEELDDPEIERVLQRMKTDAKFKNLVLTLADKV